jgi:DNA primase
MPAAEEIDVAGRSVRVTSPEREIFPAHRGAPAISKLEVVRYYASVGEMFLRSLYERPVTLERWPKGVFDGAVIATRTDSHGDAFFQKRIPKGAPEWVQTATIAFPSGRTADEVCPTSCAST